MSEVDIGCNGHLWEILAVVIPALVAIYVVHKDLRHSSKIQAGTNALMLIHDKAFEPELLAARSALFKKISEELGETYWKNLAKGTSSYANSTTEEKEFKDQVTIYFNYLETVSVAVLTNTASEEILKAKMRRQLIRATKKTKPYIVTRRNKKGDENIYSNLEELAHKWDKELRTSN